MKLSRSKKGLSLTELLVSSMLIGIIMVGVLGFDYALKAMEDTSRKASSTNMEVAAAMALLRSDIEQAIGDPDNPGILINDSGGGGNYAIALRHDNNTPPTPSDYSDDDWVCWIHGGSDDIDRHINMTYFNNNREDPSGFTFGDCEWGAIINSIDVISIDADNRQFARIITNTDGRIKYVEINLSAAWDQDTAADPLSNPQTHYKTRVSPLGLSR